MNFSYGDFSPLVPWILYECTKRILTDDHEIVFTRFDSTPRETPVVWGRVTTLLVWEYAGWYAECWEYFMARGLETRMDAWSDHLTRDFPPQQIEYGGLCYLWQIIRH